MTDFCLLLQVIEYFIIGQSTFHSKKRFLKHFELINSKYSHTLCYDFTLIMILVFQYESGNNRGIAEEILLKTSLKKQV